VGEGGTVTVDTAGGDAGADATGEHLTVSV
jgi:hypothetical protein